MSKLGGAISRLVLFDVFVLMSLYKLFMSVKSKFIGYCFLGSEMI